MLRYSIEIPAEYQLHGDSVSMLRIPSGNDAGPIATSFHLLYFRHSLMLSSQVEYMTRLWLDSSSLVHECACADIAHSALPAGPEVESYAEISTGRRGQPRL